MSYRQTCPTCEKPMSAAARFCAYCDTVLRPDDVKRNQGVFECSECGFEISVSSRNSLEDARIQCGCSRDFPEMDHTDGKLSRAGGEP